MNTLADEFLKRNLPITWTATLRADQACRLGDDLFAKTVRSGLRRVMVGVESGSQEMLDRLQKDMKLEQVRVTADMCTRHGVGAIFNFIVGFPGESEQSMQATLALAKQLRRWNPAFETPIFYYRPYPGNPLAELSRRARLRVPARASRSGPTSITSAAAVRGSPPINGRRSSASSSTPGTRGSRARGDGRFEPRRSGDASTTGTACRSKRLIVDFVRPPQQVS